MHLTAALSTTERAGVKTLRLALRWMLILATALLLAPPGLEIRPQSFEAVLIVAFALSNAVLSFLPEARFRQRGLEFVTVIADTFLVSVGLFHGGPQASHLPLVFFLTLLLAALGPDLPRIIAGASLLSGLYLFLVWHATSAGGPVEMTRLLMRLPFLYVTALYYGLWGLLADLTLVLNLFIVLAFMGGFGATLTLPGRFLPAIEFAKRRIVINITTTPFRVGAASHRHASRSFESSARHELCWFGSLACWMRGSLEERRTAVP